MYSGIDTGFCWIVCLGFPFHPDFGHTAECCLLPTSSAVVVQVCVLAHVRLILEKRTGGKGIFHLL